MSLCISSAGSTMLILAVQTFTLVWNHSVEKTTWEEDWRVEPAGLIIEEARIKGSGAGMEPPADAILEDGEWRYTPRLPPQSVVRLASSGVVPAWRLCAEGVCHDLEARLESKGEVISLQPCEAGD